MEGAGSQSALTLEDEYPHPFGARPLESQRDACRGRAPMTRRSGIELEKKGSSLHLSVPGQPAPTAKARQVFPVQRALLGIQDPVAVIPGLLVFDPQRFVQHRERAVDEGRDVTGAQHKAVRESPTWIPDVPTHGAAQERGQQDVHFGAGASRMAALAVVEDDVDELIDQILGFFPMREGGGGAHAFFPAMKSRSRCMASSMYEVRCE